MKIQTEKSKQINISNNNCTVVTLILQERHGTPSTDLNTGTVMLLFLLRKIAVVGIRTSVQGTNGSEILKRGYSSETNVYEKYSYTKIVRTLLPLIQIYGRLHLRSTAWKHSVLRN